MDTKTRDIIIRLLSARVVELERQNGELLAHLDVTTPSLEMLRPLVESNHSAYMLEIKLLRDTINRSEQPQQQLTVESIPDFEFDSINSDEAKGNWPAYKLALDYNYSANKSILPRRCRRGRSPLDQQQQQQPHIRIRHAIHLIDDLAKNSSTVAFDLHYSQLFGSKSSHWYCETCPFKSSSLPVLFTHLTRHCPRPGYLKCPHCDYYANKPQYITNHVSLHSARLANDKTEIIQLEYSVENAKTIRISEWHTTQKAKKSK